MKAKKNSSRTLRVIGGEFRSRQIEFATDSAIRPTPDRVRETLFNWLQSSVGGARCLELYGGSGILSIEALSRGASHVTVIDKSDKACRQIRNNIESLCTVDSRYLCQNAQAYDWLSQHKDKVMHEK